MNKKAETAEIYNTQPDTAIVIGTEGWILMTNGSDIEYCRWGHEHPIRKKQQFKIVETFAAMG